MEPDQDPARESELEHGAETHEPGGQEAMPYPPLEGLTAGAVIALLGAVLLPLADGLLARLAGGARIPGAVFFARWGFRHVALAVGVGLAAMIVTANLFAWMGTGFTGQMVASQFLMIGIAATAFVQARALHPEGGLALGLRVERAPSAAFGGLMAYGLSLPVLYGAMVMNPGLFELFGLEYDVQAVARQIAAVEGFELVVAGIVAVVIAPFFEEVVFRGYIQPLLVQNLHAPAGILVTSILFAALHGSAFFPILVLSCVLGWIQWRTHRTLACVVVHALHNGGNFLLIQFLPDEVFAPVGLLFLS